MRDYTYLGGARFTINNIFRSLRFDVDRLDLSWVEGEKPEFTRGLIKLSGMHRMRESREFHRPRKIAALSVTAPVQETADPPEGVRQNAIRNDEIQRAPK